MSGPQASDSTDRPKSVAEPLSKAKGLCVTSPAGGPQCCHHSQIEFLFARDRATFSYQLEARRSSEVDATGQQANAGWLWSGWRGVVAALWCGTRGSRGRAAGVTGSQVPRSHPGMAEGAGCRETQA